MTDLDADDCALVSVLDNRQQRKELLAVEMESIQQRGQNHCYCGMTVLKVAVDLQYSISTDRTGTEGGHLPGMHCMGLYEMGRV